jgi:hypothetical protein
MAPPLWNNVTAGDNQQCAACGVVGGLSDLFRAYLTLCPNSKLPIKFHAMSIEAEHFTQGPLFSGPRVSDQAAMVGGCIRNTLVKYRDLAQCSKKQLVIKKQVLLQIFLCATTGSRIYITYT